jgi:hypothetical protein
LLVGDEPLCHGRTRRDLHWLEPRPLGRERLDQGSAPRDVGVAISGAWSGLGSELETSSIALELSGFREIGRPDRKIERLEIQQRLQARPFVEKPGRVAYGREMDKKRLN